MNILLGRHIDGTQVSVVVSSLYRATQSGMWQYLNISIVMSPIKTIPISHLQRTYYLDFILTVLTYQLLFVSTDSIWGATVLEHVSCNELYKDNPYWSFSIYLDFIFNGTQISVAVSSLYRATQSGMWQDLNMSVTMSSIKTISTSHFQ